jgi:hypothetical protein
MTHRETYLRLLSSENRNELLATLESHGYFRTLAVSGARIVDGALPYVCLSVAKSDTFTAFCTGTFLDPSSWSLLTQTEEFYLPVIAVCPSASETDLAHELTHLSDLLDLVERDSTYPVRARTLAFNALPEEADLEQIVESIDFEVFKIFALEPRAHEVEYQMGTTAIDVPTLFGLFKLSYRCETSDEFVNLWLSSYAAHIGERYRTGFAKWRDPISIAVRDSIDRHGYERFGDAAFAKLEELLKSIEQKAIAQATKSVRVGDEGRRPKS